MIHPYFKWIIIYKHRHAIGEVKKTATDSVNTAPNYTAMTVVDRRYEVFCWRFTNCPVMWQPIMLQDTLQQLVTLSEPEARQLHAYCCTTHKNRLFIWTMCLSCWWGLTGQVCQRHLSLAHNRKPAKPTSNAHYFESSALCLDITHPQTTGVPASTHAEWYCRVLSPQLTESNPSAFRYFSLLHKYVGSKCFSTIGSH